MRDLQQGPKHLVLALKLTHHELGLLLEVGLLIDCQPDHTVHRQDFFTELHAMLNGFVTLLSHFYQALFSVFEKGKLSLLPRKLLLKLLVFLHQEVKCILQVLITIDKHFVILIEIVDKVFDEEQVIRVEG